MKYLTVARSVKKIYILLFRKKTHLFLKIDLSEWEKNLSARDERSEQPS